MIFITVTSGMTNVQHPSSIPKWAPVGPIRGPFGAQLCPTGAHMECCLGTCHDRESLLLYPKPISRYTSHEPSPPLGPPNKPPTSNLLLSLLPKQTQGHQTISQFTHSGKLLRMLCNTVGNTVYFKASTRALLN